MTSEPKPAATQDQPWARWRLDGSVALVTGASEGIGRGISLALARAGASVVVLARSGAALDEVVAEVESFGGQAAAVVADVTDLASLQRARAECADRFGHVDVLVNSAGYSVNVPAWHLSESDWDRTVDVGLKGVFFSCQILGDPMRERGYGKIINLSSTLSRGVVPGAAAYATVKAAVSHLTRALAVEWAAEGIRVNAIAPASTATPSRLARQTPEHRERLAQRIPLGRIGTVDDLVPAALYLAHGDSDFMTGQTLHIDGGWTAA